MRGTDTLRTRGGRRPFRLVAGAIAASVATLALGVVLATPARAVTGAAGQTMFVSPSTVMPGQSVTVTGNALGCNTVTLLSKAFPSTTEFASVPSVAAASTGGRYRAKVTIPATRAPGDYSIGARACGANLGVSVTLIVRSQTPVPATGTSIAPFPAIPALLLIVAGATAVGAALGRRRTG
jgi:hypothetical protein